MRLAPDQASANRPLGAKGPWVDTKRRAVILAALCGIRNHATSRRSPRFFCHFIGLSGIGGGRTIATTSPDGSRQEVPTIRSD